MDTPREPAQADELTVPEQLPDAGQTTDPEALVASNLTKGELASYQKQLDFLDKNYLELHGDMGPVELYAEKGTMRVQRFSFAPDGTPKAVLEVRLSSGYHNDFSLREGDSFAAEDEHWTVRTIHLGNELNPWEVTLIREGKTLPGDQSLEQ